MDKRTQDRLKEIVQIIVGNAQVEKAIRDAYDLGYQTARKEVEDMYRALQKTRENPNGG